MSESRLVRSENDRIIAGVCGGLASYLEIDPALVRMLHRTHSMIKQSERWHG